MIEAIKVDDPAIGINIAGSYRYGMSATALYHCTRGTWRLSKRHAEKAQYAFAVFKGIIREVYEIERWFPAGATEHSFGPAPGRYEFVGRVADDEMRDKYVGKQILEPPGQNPIRYYNC